MSERRAAGAAKEERKGDADEEEEGRSAIVACRQEKELLFLRTPGVDKLSSKSMKAVQPDGASTWCSDTMEKQQLETELELNAIKGTVNKAGGLNKSAI